MSAFLAPSFGAGYQAFDNVGAVLAGGKLYTYQAGSTTAQATWTDSTQAIQNANPIILNSAGRLANEVWLQGGRAYKFVLTDSSGNQLASWDYVSGVNDANYAGFSEWVVFGSSPSYVSASSFTVTGNQVSTFQASRRVQLFLLGGTYYGTVSSSSYNSGPGNTTVNVTLDSGSLDATLYAVSYGFMSATNTSVPALFIQALNAALTGIPTAPTAAAGTDTIQIATTAFAMHMQSPAFTGIPTAPTAAPGTNSTQIATMAALLAQSFVAALPSQTGNAGKEVITDGSTASWSLSPASAVYLATSFGAL